jgi:hypothetical protein
LRPVDLDIGQAKLSESLLELCFGLAQAPGHAADQGGQGVDGDAGLVQLRGLEREVEGGELEKAEGVIGHDDLGWRIGQLALELGQASLVTGVAFVDCVAVIDGVRTVG